MGLEVKSKPFGPYLNSSCGWQRYGSGFFDHAPDCTPRVRGPIKCY
jgi:hypothetical protein